MMLLYVVHIGMAISIVISQVLLDAGLFAKAGIGFHRQHARSVAWQDVDHLGLPL